jgi:preprotein translocase subunit SecG
MYTVITILIIITSVLLALVVMVQNAKGGGLASGFASSGQIMGVQKTTDFIEKLTWGLALTLVVLCLAASFALPTKEQRTLGSSMQEQIDNSGNAQQKNTPSSPPPKPPGQQAQPAQQANPQKK